MSLPNNLQLCRLCLFEKNSYVDIFEINEKHGFRISDVINEMLELDVSPGDGLPERICEDCLTEMARFKRFKKLCQEAKLTLNYIIALAAGTVPPPTSLPSFLTASQNSVSDSTKSTVSLSVPKSTCVPVASSEPSNSLVNTVPVNTNCVTSTSLKPTSSCQTAVQVNFDGGSSSAANDVVTPQPQSPLQNPIKFENGEVFSEQITDNFVEAQEDSDLDNLCDGPLPVETVLSEPDAEAVQGSRLIGGVIPVIPTNGGGGGGDSLGMFPISSIMNDLHQFPTYAPSGAGMDHSIFENPSEPEVVDLVDDEDGETVVVLPDSYPVAAVMLPDSGDDSGDSLPGSEGRSVNFKNEGNEDSDLENMCEDPLPVETVLSEPDSELGSGAAKCGGEQNALDGRDDSFGLFSLTSTFGDLMSSSEDNGCVSRTSHAAILSAEQSPQENIKDAVGSGQLNNADKYPFWCPICGKNFMRKDKLKQHSVVHSNERPFICRICGCSYKRKDKLTSHVTSSHLQHLPHQCDICGKRFVRKDKLKQHSVVHSNRRPYVCKECGKRYKLKTELKKHEKRTHSQENPA